jgi:hypothetical protein
MGEKNLPWARNGALAGVTVVEASRRETIRLTEIE